MFCAVGRAFSSITTGCVSNTFLTVFHFLRFLRTAGFSGHFSCKAEKSLKLQDFPDFHVHPCTTIGKTEYENGVQEAASSNLVTRTRKYRKTYVLRYFSSASLRNCTGMNRTKPVCFGLLHTLLHTISRGQTGTDRISRLLQQQFLLQNIV